MIALVAVESPASSTARLKTCLGGSGGAGPNDMTVWYAQQKKHRQNSASGTRLGTHL